MSKRVSPHALHGAALAAMLAGCTSSSGSPSTVAAPGAQSARSSKSAGLDAPLLADVGLPALAHATAQTTSAATELAPVPNGVDDGENDGQSTQPPGPGLAALATAQAAVMVPIAPPAGAHPLVCDLVPFAGALYTSFAVAPVNLDGARIYRLDTTSDTWTLAFDWDRGGTPGKTHEVGGQGIPRLRVIAGRLFATDGDAPLYGGFGLSSAPFEDYLFVSDETGAFAPLGPDMSPPAGTRILPLAFHVFDVISYHGALVASGGTVSLRETGTRYPGGLFVGALDSPLLWPIFRPGEGVSRAGVVRTTYMHRFRGRLYVGFQNNERVIRWDLGVLSGDPRDPATPPPVLVRVTPDGGWLTKRFASGDGTLYWIASGYSGDGRGGALWSSTDGLRFTRISLPEDAGAPQDLVIIGNVRYLLARGGLYRALGDHRFTRISPAPSGDPFGRGDSFCGAPLTVAGDSLYAGSTRDGTVYRIAVR